MFIFALHKTLHKKINFTLAGILLDLAAMIIIIGGILGGEIFVWGGIVLFGVVLLIS